MNSLKVPALIDPNRRPVNGESQSYFKSMHEFPRRATVLWRGETPKVAILVQPLSKMDETKNKGAGIVLITQLIMFGILKPLSHDGTQGDLKHLELEDGWEKRTMMFVRDGLTMARIKSFDELLSSSPMEYTMKHEKAVILRKALSRVVVVTGDLHGCFHCLMPVYSLFYGALILPIQTVLKWKRIQGSDITKCYQQANGLTTMISDEVERHLVTHCISEMEDNPENVRHLRELRNDPKKVALYLTTHYLNWIESKRSSTTNDVFRMSLNFVTMMTKFKHMVMAGRSGDSIMIESMYVDMLPIFEVAGKKNYIKITCSMIENLYSNMDPKNLQRVRLNRTFPLYTGRNSKGELMAHKAIDDHLYDNVSSVGNGEEEEDADKDVELPEGFYGNEGSDNESDEPIERMSSSSDNLADKGEVDIATDKHTKMKIRRAAVNELAFKDVVSEGRRKLEKKNLHVVRYRSFQRENRKKEIG